MLTLSVIKADTGGYVGHSAVHPEMLAAARAAVADAVARGLIVDGQVAHCGDDVSLIMTHNRGSDCPDVHGFAWQVFGTTTHLATRLGLYRAGQDMYADEFSGNLRGMGPGYAELDFEERPSEPVMCFLADKAGPGAWNMPLYKIFADPFNTAGLVIDPKMHAGFAFEVYDLDEDKRMWFDAPRDIYDLLMLIGAPSRYIVHAVRSKTLDETAATTSTQRWSLISGTYVGKDDPVMIVRAQAGLPAVGEVLEPFAFPYAVAGSMRGSHHAPIMPVSVAHATPTRFDGPPRVIALGYQIKRGRLIGPRDMFDDPSYDRARQQANQAMDYFRRHGPFEPHRLPLAELQYTTTSGLERSLADRWEPLPGTRPAVDASAR